MEKESSINKNKMHLERFKEIIGSLQPEEVEIVCNLLVREHTEEVLRSLKNYICEIQQTINTLRSLP